MNNIFRQLGCLAASSYIIILAQPVLAESVREFTVPRVAQSVEVISANFARHFQDLGAEGSIYIYDLKQNIAYEHNRDRNVTPFLPASTFKIPNSLIALETGVIPNDVSVLTWDGIERPMVTAWNRDLNLRQAFKFSAVWFYQVLARRIGYDRMKYWVNEVGYGNQNIGSEAEIDTFWLNGDLRITPQEQVQFLRRFYNNKLPFSESAIATVKDIMIMEQTPDYTIRAKTGWAATMGVGWYVGYVEQYENIYFFATNIDIQDQNDLSKRIEVTRRCLENLELL